MVTGGAGFIGSHLIDALILEKPAKIVVVDNFFLGRLENLKDAQRNFKKLIVYKQDATDYKEMEKIIKKEKINIVFNLATKALEHSFVDPDDAYMVNGHLAPSAPKKVSNIDSLLFIGSLWHSSKSSHRRGSS